VPGQYDVRELGLNCRLSEMQAAIGLHQLERLPGFLAQRRSNWIALHEALGPLERRGILRVLPAADSTNEQSGHYCCAVVLAPELQPAREAVVEGLRGAGVGTSIYYPHPVPLLEYYRRRYDHDVTEFPGAREISYGSIALPVGPHINADGIAHIASAVMTACEGLSPSD
jgi:dTDP-4-amino-4,6-dideoxygalactose transaminase